MARYIVVALHAAQAGALLLGPSTPAHEAISALPHFDAFIETFGRAYRKGTAEYKLRRTAFEDRTLAAQRQNSRTDRLWTAGVNFLWDWTEDEFSRLRDRRGPRAGSSSHGVQSALVQLQKDNVSSLPQEKSWAHLVAQRHIANQGGCGSCWAIAAVTVLQAHTEIYTKKVRTFSAQQLVSCVQNPQHCGGEGGCRGATVELAYAWVMQHGLAQDYEVPYAGVDGSCGVLQGAKTPTLAAAGGPAAFGMHGWERLPENKYEPLVRALTERGPVAVSVSASPWAVYKSGIFDGCPTDAIIDHAVVLVAFGAAPGEGTSKTHKFWTIQNSWGTGWGESGKIRLLRHDDEGAYCGINSEPEKGTGCDGGPSQVKVCGTCGILYDNVVPHF